MAQTTYRRRRRKRPKSGTISRIAVTLVIIAGVLIALRSAANDEPDRPDLGGVTASQLMKVSGAPADGVIVDYPGFTVSFNPTMHQPNYVAWELTAEEAAAEGKRESKFDTDPSVEGMPELDDYRNSGFDRGHMIPAGDVKWSREAMAASHLLTNICPQDHSLNSGAWASLENTCRKWARRDSSLIIICGPVLSDRMPRSIGRRNTIPVPERFFKVIVAPYVKHPRGIAFIMNNGYVEGGMQAAAVTIDKVESITGYDFFAALPDSIEDAVESQCEFHKWQHQ